MRRLITTTFVTLDGVMQAPGGPEEDTSEGFEYGGWTVPFWHEKTGEFMGDTMGKPFDLVLGRKTYDIFAGYWPKHEDNPIGKSFGECTKYVASRSEPKLTWKNSQHIDGDLIEGVKALKQQDGPELQVHGSGNMIQTLLGGDVIDEMRVLIFPVTVGSGKRLFGDGAVGTKFNVTRTEVAPNGVFMAIYEPAGEVETGYAGE